MEFAWVLLWAPLAFVLFLIIIGQIVKALSQFNISWGCLIALFVIVLIATEIYF
jgi:hypothetical protein